MSARVHEKILRLYISMTDSDAVNVGKRAEDLVGIELDEDIGDFMLALTVVFDNFVKIPWNVVHDNIQVHFIGLNERH